MKISPVVGTGTPAGLENAPTRSPDKIERAKAIAAGLEPQPIDSTGNTQADKAQQTLRTIQMKTQMSTNRDDIQYTQDVAGQAVRDAARAVAQSVIPDASEQAQSTEETKPLSPQFAALAKAKRALQVKEREIAQREEALKSAPAGEDWKATLKANPLSVLQEAGVTYDQLTEAILNSQGAPIDPAKLRAEIKEELKKEFLNEFSTRDQQAEQQVLSELKREAAAITATGDDYEAIRQAKAQNTVVDLIHRTWKQTGEIMDVTEAAQLVENQLIEEALPFAQIKKVQSKLTPSVPEVPAEQPPANPNRKVMRTLTNRDNASPVLDRRARAIAAMNGTLKR